MKNIHIKVRTIVTVAIVLGLVFSGLGITNATVYEGQNIRVSERQNIRQAGMPTGPDATVEQAKQPEYAKGELIIKLKEGKTMDDIKGLNEKYNVSSAEKVFKDTATPQDKLKALKDRLAGLAPEHQGWYWQLDKGSAEYKEYIERIEKDKEGLTKQIQAQEELVARIAEKQKQGVEMPKLDNIYILKVGEATDISGMMQEYASNPVLEYAEPNYKVRAQVFPTTLPDDTYIDPDQNNAWSTGAWGQAFEDMWGLKKIQADKAWQITQGEGVIVAVVDSGVDYNHEDIAENIWINPAEIPNDNIDNDDNGYIDDVRGWNFAYNNNDPMDDFGHGTHVAGTIAAIGNNNLGIIGVAPKAKIMALKGLNNLGEGDTNLLANAIFYAANNGARVINNSWGNYEAASQTLSEAVDHAHDLMDCVVIAAAGNDNMNAAGFFPANLTDVITVAAIDHNNIRSQWSVLNNKSSNYGMKVDVAAPGGGNPSLAQQESDLVRSILSLLSSGANSLGGLVVGDKYLRQAGTSMAAPHVSGVCALLVSKFPDLDAEQVRQILKQTSNASITSEYYIGTGIVDAYQALEQGNSSIQLEVIITAPQLGSMFYFSNSIHIEAQASPGRSYTIKYGAGLYPQQWTQSVSGVAPDSGNISENLDTSGLQDGVYAFKIEVSDGANNVYDKCFGSKLGEMKPGWPRTIQTLVPEWQILGYAPLTSPVFADLTGDGRNELITGINLDSGFNGGVYAFSSNGDPLDGFPQPVQHPLWSMPCVADLNGDGKGEVMLGDYDISSSGAFIHAWKYDGSQLSGWPQYFMPNSGSFVITPVVADLDKDNDLEVIATVRLHGTVNILDGSGQPIEGWNWPQQADTGAQVYESPAVGDINNDGKLEVVIISKNGLLSVFDYKGDLLDNGYNWPVDLPTLFGDPEMFITSLQSPVLGDLDGDGKLEIIVNFKIGNNEEIAVFSYQGQLFFTGFPLGSRPSLGDINQDGNLEIVYLGFNSDGMGTIGIRDHNMESPAGWQSPTRMKGPASGIAIGDIDNNDKQDIVAGFGSKLFAWDAGGQLLEGWPKEFDGNILESSTPCLGDLDNDGFLDIAVIVTPWSSPAQYRVCVLTTNTPYDKNKMEWPMSNHNPQNTNCYAVHADVARPSGTITMNDGDVYYNASIPTVKLQATDNVGVIAYYLSDNSAAPQADSTGWVTVDSTRNFSFTISAYALTGEGIHTLYAWYKDAVGHISNTASDSIIIDTIRPSINTVELNNGTEYYNHSDVPVFISATDDGTGIVGYLLSSGGDWQTCEPTTTLSITTVGSYSGFEGGSYTCSVWVKDAAGNISNTASDSIIIDMLFPFDTSILINAGAETAYSRSVTLNLYAQDNISGVSEMRFSNDGNTWSDPEPYAVTKQWTLTEGEGEKTVYAIFKDAAGNWSSAFGSAAANDSINLVLMPDAASNLELTAVSSKTVSLKWQDNSGNEAGFIIERKTDGDFSEVARVGADVVVYEDTGLEPGTVYTYRVIAYNDSGNSGYSNEINVTTKPAVYVNAIILQRVLFGQALAPAQ